MKRLTMLTLGVGFALLAHDRAYAWVEEGVLDNGETAWRDFWPPGLRELAAGPGRVHGRHMIAHSFGKGDEEWAFYFQGDPRAFNQFIASYAALRQGDFSKDAPLTLILHLGKGEVQSLLGEMGQRPIVSPDFDWLLSVRAFEIRTDRPYVRVALELWISRSFPLSELKVPREIRLTTLFEAFIRQHEDKRLQNNVTALEHRVAELRRELDKAQQQLELSKAATTAPANKDARDPATKPARRASVAPPIERPGKISGLVVSTTTGDPVAGAYVGIGDLGDAPNLATALAEQGRFAHTETNKEGRFTLSNLALCEHPLIVTHPEFVCHDRIITLGPQASHADLRIALKPAAQIHVAVVDATGKPVRDEFTFRVEALDGHRFIPPGRNRHESSFASPCWITDGQAGAVLFTELDEGEYAIDVMRATGEAAPHQWVLVHTTYYGGLSPVTVRPGEKKDVQIRPQDNATLVKIKLSGPVLTTPTSPLVAGVILSRNLGLLVWDAGLGYGPEFPHMSRIHENALVRMGHAQERYHEKLGDRSWPTTPFPEAPLEIRNLPPGSYSLFVSVVPHLVLKGAKVEVVRGRETLVPIELVQWKQLSQVNLLNMGRRVKLESKEYRVQELCDLLSATASPVPRFKAEPSLRNEILRFDKKNMSLWEIVEKIHADKGWRVVEEGNEALVFYRPSEVGVPAPSSQPAPPGKR